MTNNTNNKETEGDGDRKVNWGDPQSEDSPDQGVQVQHHLHKVAETAEAQEGDWINSQSAEHHHHQACLTKPASQPVYPGGGPVVVLFRPEHLPRSPHTLVQDG